MGRCTPKKGCDGPSTTLVFSGDTLAIAEDRWMPAREGRPKVPVRAARPHGGTSRAGDREPQPPSVVTAPCALRPGRLLSSARLWQGQMRGFQGVVPLGQHSIGKEAHGKRREDGLG